MFARFIMLLIVASVLWAAFARASDGAGRPEAYVVQPGDSLWSIAAEHYPGDPREGVWKLQRGNDLQDPAIFPGQRLLLP